MPEPPFHRHLGIELVRRGSGEAETGLQLGGEHLNQRGVAHGGVVAALLDTTLGAAVISSIPEDWWCATTSLAIQFIEGAGAGRLRATGRVLRRGLRVAHAAGEVRDARERLVASAQGTWHLWSGRPAAPAEPLRGWIEERAGGARLRVGKVVCVGRNYAAHAAEMGAPAGGPPVLFLKPPGAVDGGTAVRIPSGLGAVHHEVELVVVIGSPGREIPAARAAEHVLGYAVGLDLTLRDVQEEAKRRGEPWTLSKGFDGAAPVSAIAPRDEVGDGSGLEIGLEVNGERRQHGSTSQMLHGVAALVAHASRWMTLERGDLLFTGTPAGVGPLRPGDRVEAWIERVGRLSLAVEARP